MPTFERDGVTLQYEEYGEGFPVLLFAPGGMRSSMEFWERAPWDPRKELSGDFRVIAMDQRNAGRSSAPVRADDGWHVYTADHIALLEHLGIRSTHILGGCIGGSFCLSLMRAVPDRVTAAILQQPIGLSENRSAFHAMFDGWAEEVGRTQGLDGAVLRQFRERMYGGDFVFSVSREFVKTCRCPALVLMGNDLYHPTEISREIVDLMPKAELVERWKEPEHLPAAVEEPEHLPAAIDRVRSFLMEHTPRVRP